MRRVASYVGVPSIRGTRNTAKIVMNSIQMRNLSSISHLTPSMLFMRSLRTKWCPAPSSKLKLTHHPWWILVISQRGRKQTPPERTWASSSKKLMLLPHLLLICLSTRDFKEPLWLLQSTKEALLKPQKLLSADESFKMTFYQRWFATREAAILRTQMVNLSLSSSKTG